MSTIRHTLLGSALGGVLMAAPAFAGTLTVVHSFTGGAEGSAPFGSVTIDPAGNLYGETTTGGEHCPIQNEYQKNGGCGTVYRTDTAGNTTALATFTGANGAFGFGSLALVGTRLFGSAISRNGGPGLGLMFSVMTDGTGFKVLHRFTGLDGASPRLGSPVVTADGTLYSVTVSGGPGYVPHEYGSGSGVLFKLMADGTYVTLHDFTGGADGSFPSQVAMSAAGVIYGAASSGGQHGAGVIYSYATATGAFTVLHTFTGRDGDFPYVGGISQNGTIYGATFDGGRDGDGTLFSLTPSGATYDFATLWNFTGGADGGDPYSGPSVAADGTLTGITSGTADFETPTELYRFAAGTLTPLASLSTYTGAGQPLRDGDDTPTVTSSGAIYGTTVYGGTGPCLYGTATYGCGAIFKYVP